MNYYEISKHFTPKQNKVVFNNFNGKGFGCNPKYLALEFLRQDPSIDLVWLVADINDNTIPSPIRKVQAYSPQAVIELSSAKVIVTNVKNALPFYKSEDQILIQTWHGSRPFKAIEGMCESQLDPQYLIESKHTSEITDIFLSDCVYMSEIYRKFFWYKNAIWELGMPRDDVLINTTQEEKEVLKAKLGLPLDKKIWIYAPTFRKQDLGMGNGEDIYSSLDFNRLNNQLVNRFGSDWHGILRLHPNVRISELQYDHAIATDFSHYMDPQELFIVADVLITDYSTVCSDFFIMKKPVFLFTPDLDDYMTADRPLLQTYFELPVKPYKLKEEFFLAIAQFDMNEYQKALLDYQNKFNIIADGKASFRIVNYLLQFFR